MARRGRRRIRRGAPGFAVGACLVALSAPDIAGQAIPCDDDLIGSLQLPDIRTSAARAPLRVAPEPDAKVVVTLPADIAVPLLEELDGWFLVNHRHGGGYRRLYVSARDAELSSAEGPGPRQAQVQEWAAAHSLACERIAGQRFAVKSFAAAAVVAGLTSIIWRVYIEDDDHYGTGFGVWTAVSIVSLVGAIYKGYALSRAKKSLADLGAPSFAAGGATAGLPRADLRFDPVTGRLAVVAAWRR